MAEGAGVWVGDAAGGEAADACAPPADSFVAGAASLGIELDGLKLSFRALEVESRSPHDHVDDAVEDGVSIRDVAI